jgi:proteasome lid subunit RPN8/RPN11
LLGKIKREGEGEAKEEDDDHENAVVISVVDQFLPIRNANTTYGSFEIPPDELLKAYDHADKIGTQVTAIFHSHPSPPRPSATDIRFMEINPVVWVIYSTTEERFAAWIFVDEAFDDGDNDYSNANKRSRVREVKIVAI